MEVITPSLDASDIYQQEAREPRSYTATPAGTYEMALESLSVVKTRAGERQLKAFFIHTDATNGFKGVNYFAMLEGTNANGKPKAKAFGDFLASLGFDTADIIGGKAAVALTGEADPEAAWKGAPATVTINGDAVDLKGRRAVVKLADSEYNGKVTTKATATYKIAA